MSKIHVFLGTGRSLRHASTGYPVGESHAFLVFLHQTPGSGHDWSAAEAYLQSKSWGDINCSKAGTASNPKPTDVVADAYDAPVEGGRAVIVYSDAIDQDEQC